MIVKQRYLLYFLVYKNLQLKYKHSLLGILWSIIHPLFFLLIFVVVFSEAFMQIKNYPLFVVSGLIFWVFFSGSTNQLSQVFIKHTHLIKTRNIAVHIYAVAEQGSELLSFLIGLIPFLVLMFFFGLPITLNLLWILPVILLFTLFTFSLGLILGSLNVYFRDVSILWNTLNPALFYLSPIAFSYEIIPEKFKFVALYNPLFYFLSMIRDVLYKGMAPDVHVTWICCLLTLVAFLTGLFIYNRTRNGFVSNL